MHRSSVRPGCGTRAVGFRLPRIIWYGEAPRNIVGEKLLVGPKRKGLALPAFGLPAWFNAATNIAVLASLVEYSLSTVPPSSEA